MMEKTGIATLPLHGGRAPRWLLSRMAALAGEIASAIVIELGRREFLRRMSDPYWFQSFGCVLGFDWHSSGLTTTVTGALKEGLRGREYELGLFVAGGKGSASRRTPNEIRCYADKLGLNADPLIYASRMSAKVDSAAVQDGYQLYHHVFAFTAEGQWSVIQQGMNDASRMARRYHWMSDGVESFVVEPHAAVCSDERHPHLNMVARESEDARRASVVISRERPDKLICEITRIMTLELPRRHRVTFQDIDMKRFARLLQMTHEQMPGDFEELLALKGVGPKSIGALSLIAEIIYGARPSFRDPARFSFAHGGKDGTPYPVDKKTYDESIAVMRKAIEATKIGNAEKLRAVRRLLSRFGDV